MEIQEIDIGLLKKAEYNPRIMAEPEFEGLKASLKTFGFVEPLIINKDYTVIGGHQRLRAAMDLDFEKVPCFIVDLSKKEEKKLNIVLNSPSISGKFDEKQLSLILEELKLDDNYEELRLDDLEPLDISRINREAEEEWTGMPDFANKENVYARSVVFHFRTVEDFDEFISQNGLEATDKTRYIVI